MQPTPIVLAGDLAARMAGALAVVAAIAAAAFAVARRNCRRFKFVVSFMVVEGRSDERFMLCSVDQCRGVVLVGNDTGFCDKYHCCSR
jgi:predicted regulator of Ras-like GTPase activity (Roadblock/LC7/MglB family)